MEFFRSGAPLLRRHRTAIDLSGASLARSLGLTQLVSLGIGATIGAGVFVLTGVAAATEAGPAVSLSFVLSGGVCALTALAYAELAAAVGGCGSAYGYAYAALGEIVAWIIGWALMLEYGLSIAAVAVGWSGYLVDLLASFGIHLPFALLHAPSEAGSVNLPAVLVIVALGGLLAAGARSTAWVNNVMVVVKLLAIGIFLAVAARHVDVANWQPYMPFGWEGVAAGAALVFFAFIGFDAVSTAAEEARNPQRDLPLGIIGSLAACILIYVAVAGTLTGVRPYQTLNVASPVAQVLLELGARVAAGLVAAGALAGLTSVMLVSYYGQTRILYAMSRDGLLPGAFAAIHARSRAPVIATAVTGAATAAIAGFVPLSEIAELVNMGTLAAFAVVCVGVVALRRLQPDLPRPFRMPLVPHLPVIGALACVLLMFQLSALTWLAFAIWMTLGLCAYFGYGYHHARAANPP